METFSALLAICAGNSPVTSEVPTQRPVPRSFAVFFDLRLNPRLSKQSWLPLAGNLRRYRAHYDVIVMSPKMFYFSVELIASAGMLGAGMGYPCGLIHEKIGNQWSYFLALVLSGTSALLLFVSRFYTDFFHSYWQLFVVLWMLYGKYYFTYSEQ